MPTSCPGRFILAIWIAVPLVALAADPAGRLIDGPAGKLYVETRGTAPGRPLLIVNGGPPRSGMSWHGLAAW